MEYKNLDFPQDLWRYASEASPIDCITDAI